MTSGTFIIDPSRCTFCGGCASVCPSMAIEIEDNDSRITERCTRCGACRRFCPVSAVDYREQGSQNAL